MICPPMARKPALRQRRVKAFEQNLDRRLCRRSAPRQRLTEIPDRVRVRHAVGERQPQETHERYGFRVINSD